MSIGTHATARWTDEDGVYHVRYHEIEIFQEITTEAGRFVILEDGGHKSATTKKRINECFNERGIPWELKQVKGAWLLSSKESTWAYVSGQQIKVL